MILINDLLNIAKTKLEIAKLLFANNYFDDCVYFSGYTIELALKAQICKALNWDGFPNTSKEFDKFKSFRVHDLETLLQLSSLYYKMKDNEFFNNFNIIMNWSPELRYNKNGTMNKEKTHIHLQAVIYIWEILLQDSQKC